MAERQYGKDNGNEMMETSNMSSHQRCIKYSAFEYKYKYKYSNIKYKYKYKYSTLKYKYKYKYPSFKYKYKYKYPTLKYKYEYKYFVFTASTYQVCNCQCDKKNRSFSYRINMYYSYAEKYNLVNKMVV